MGAALQAEGLEEKRLFPKSMKVWALPGEDVDRFYSMHAYRRPWGFVCSGYIGVDIPALREWLRKYKPGEQAGVFHTCFVCYCIANEDVLNDFRIILDDPVPADLWAGLLKDRLLRVPDSLEGLIAMYRGNREALGFLAHPHERHVWEFLMRWRDNPDPEMPVPRRLPNWQVVWI